MEDNLPTTPGPFWWRETDGDEWRLCNVFRGDDRNLYFETVNISGPPVDDMSSQWLPIPTADELVELQRKAQMLDNLLIAAKRVEGMLEPLNQKDDKHARDFSKAISDCYPEMIKRKEKFNETT